MTVARILLPVMLLANLTLSAKQAQASEPLALEATITGKSVTLVVVMRAPRSSGECYFLGDISAAKFTAADGTSIELPMHGPLLPGIIARPDGQEHRYAVNGTFASDADARRVAKISYAFALYECLNLISGREKIGLGELVETVPVFR